MADPFWANFRKKLFGTPYSANNVIRSTPYPTNRWQGEGDTVRGRNIGYASAGKPTVQYGGGQAGMFKNPLGKMSPEELKDFQEVLKEMNFNMKPEFVSPGRTNQPQMGSFKHQPFLFDESTGAEYQKRKKLFPYV